MKEILLEFKEKKSFVEIERIFDEGDHSQNGFIIDVSDRFCVFQQFDDFQDVGYRIFRIEDITSCASSDRHVFCRSLMEREGLLDQVIYDHTINIQSMKTILQTFLEQRKCILIECEIDDDYKEFSFFCAICEIEQDMVWINYFDDIGEWNDEWDGIKIDSITMIEFNSLYLNIFENYLKSEYEKSLDE